MESHKPRSRYVFFLFILILMLGIALRFYQLGKEGLWQDEIFTVYHAQQESLKEVISLVAQTEAAPPTHYIFLHYWMMLFGHSEFSVRLPSVIFSILAIVVLFSIALRLFDERVAILSTLFISTSMLQVLFAQEARMYAMFTFLSLLAAYFFVRILQGGGKKHYVGYVTAMMLALYTNYMAFFVMVLFTFLIYWKRWKLKGRWYWAQAVVIIAALPLIPLMMAQFGTLNAGLSSSLAAKHLPVFLANLGLLFYALPFAGLVGIMVLMSIKKNKIKNMFSHPYPDWFFVSCLGVFSLGYLYLVFFPFELFGIPLTRVPITHSYFLIRHAFFLVPLLYLYLAVRVASLDSKKLLAFCVGLIVVMNTIALGAYYDHTTKPQWKEAVGFVYGHGSVSPFILLDKGGFSNEQSLRYYAPSPPQLVKLSWSEEGRNFEKIDDKELGVVLRGIPEFWLVLSRNPRTQDYYLHLLDRRYHRDISQEFTEVKVYHYTNENFK